MIWISPRLASITRRGVMKPCALAVQAGKNVPEFLPHLPQARQVGPGILFISNRMLVGEQVLGQVVHTQHLELVDRIIVVGELLAAHGSSRYHSKASEVSCCSRLSEARG